MSDNGKTTRARRRPSAESAATLAIDYLRLVQQIEHPADGPGTRELSILE